VPNESSRCETEELKFYKTTERSCSRNEISEGIQVQDKRKGATNS
jgi:hypothetical protein